MKLNEKGFVLVEFIIALPLIILLLCGLVQSTLMILKAAKEHSADYVLEVEAQDVLERITQDLRTAELVSIYDANVYQVENPYDAYENIFIKYHANSTSYSKYVGKKYKLIQDNYRVLDIIDTRFYIVSKTGDRSEPYIYSQRQGGYHSSPITGGKFFGDTAVTCLKYEQIEENVLHITLEMKSTTTNHRIRLSTAVYMPACQKIERL